MSRELLNEPPLLLVDYASNNVHAVIRFWGQGGERDKQRKREGEEKSMREKGEEAREGKGEKKGKR